MGTYGTDYPRFLKILPRILEIRFRICKDIPSKLYQKCKVLVFWGWNFLAYNFFSKYFTALAKTLGSSLSKPMPALHLGHSNPRTSPVS